MPDTPIDLNTLNSPVYNAQSSCSVNQATNQIFSRVYDFKVVKMSTFSVLPSLIFFKRTTGSKQQYDSLDTYPVTVLVFNHSSVINVCLDSVKSRYRQVCFDTVLRCLLTAFTKYIFRWNESSRLLLSLTILKISN